MNTPEKIIWATNLFITVTETALRIYGAQSTAPAMGCQPVGMGG